MPAQSAFATMPARTRSIEVFPARAQRQLRRNVAAVRKLLKLDPDFVTVTYGAGGSGQEGTRELVTWIAQTGVPTYAHLTCQAVSLPALDAVIDELIATGVSGILALRGDPRPDAHLVLAHADALVRRIVDRASAAGRVLGVAVAAYPNGHPESANLREDATTLLRKQDAGARFAITQHFFDADDYIRFRDLADAVGVTIPIIPGLTPTATVRRARKIAELSGLEAPESLIAALDAAGSENERRTIATRTTVALATRLADAGAPGIQLFTLNDEPTAAQVFRTLSELFGHEATRNEPWHPHHPGPASKEAPSSATRESAAIAS